MIFSLIQSEKFVVNGIFSLVSLLSKFDLVSPHFEISVGVFVCVFTVHTLGFEKCDGQPIKILFQSIHFGC